MPNGLRGFRKNLIFIFLLALLAAVSCVAVTVWLALPTGSGNKYYWENPQIGELKAAPSAVYSPHFPDLSSALLSDQASPYEINLDGDWHRTTLLNSSEISPRLLKTQFDDSAWPKVAVPGFYRPANDQYPVAWQNRPEWLPEWVAQKWPVLAGVNPPYVPVDSNLVELFRKRLVIPEEWARKQVRINFAAPHGAFAVWVNGVQVGYAEGDGADYEFDISTALGRKDNVLAVAFTRWSDADYLEQHSGPLKRGFGGQVRLKARNSVYFRELNIASKVVGNARQLTFEADIAHDGAGRYSGTAEYYLMPPFFQPEVIPNRPLASKHLIVESGRGAQHSLRANLRKPVLWYPDSPAIYTVAAVLRSDQGTLLDVVKRKIAFREVDWNGTQLSLNNKPYPLRTVRYDLIHPRAQQVLKREELLADLRLLRLHNVNALYSGRGAYPNELLELTDELGFLVIDTLPVHSGGLVLDNSWSDELQRRWRRSVAKATAHPSVVALAVTENQVPDDSSIALLQHSQLDNLFEHSFAPAHADRADSLFTNQRQLTDTAIRYRHANAPVAIALEPLANDHLLLDNSRNRLPMQNNYRLFQRTLYKDGTAKEQKIGINVAAGEMKKQPVYVKPGMGKGKVAAVNFELRPFANTPLLSRNDKLQVEQVVLTKQAGKPLAGMSPEPLKVFQTTTEYIVKNRLFSASFNTLTGELVAFGPQGENLLATPMSSALITPIKSSEFEPRKDKVAVRFNFDSADIKGTWDYQVYNDGRIEVELQLASSPSDAATLRLQPAAEYRNFRSFARINGARHFEFLRGIADTQPKRLAGNQWLAMLAKDGSGLLLELELEQENVEQNIANSALTMRIDASSRPLKQGFTLRLVTAKRGKQDSVHVPPRTWRLQPQAQPQVEFRGPN